MIARIMSVLLLHLLFLSNFAMPAHAEIRIGILAQPQGIEQNRWTQPDNDDAEFALQAALLATKNSPPKQLLVLQALADLYHENKKTDKEKEALVAWIDTAMGIREYPLIYVATQNLRLSQACYALGECENAKKAALIALEMYRINSGELSPNVALALNNLAWIEIKQKEYSAAEFHLTYALSIIDKVVGKSSLFYGLIADNLAAFYGQRGDYRKALPYYKASLKALKQQLADDDPATLEVLRRYTEAQRIVKEQQYEEKTTARSKRRLAGDEPTHK